MQVDREVTKRIKFGLGELLSNVGGLYSALFAIGWSLAVMFGHWNMQAKLVERLYEPKATENRSAKGLINHSLFKWDQS
jgi:glucose-6-phosphate isomerase